MRKRRNTSSRLTLTRDTLRSLDAARATGGVQNTWTCTETYNSGQSCIWGHCSTAVDSNCLACGGTYYYC